MEVTIPGQAAVLYTHAGERCPLYGQGTRVKVKDASFFRQLTRGHEENGVIHSKVVGLNPKLGSVLDCVDVNGKRIVSCPARLIKSGTNLFYTWRSYTSGTMYIKVQVGGMVGNIISGYYAGYGTVSIYTYVVTDENPNKIRYTQRTTMGRVYSSEYKTTPNNRKGYYDTLSGTRMYIPDVGTSRSRTQDEARYTMAEDAVSVFLSWADTQLSIHHIQDFGKRVGSWKSTVSVVSLIQPHAAGAFSFDEVEISRGTDRELLGRTTYGYWYNWLIQHAYYDALKSMPTLNDNSISNALEVIGFVKALVVDHKIEIPKRLQDAWLSYRYVYNTTKMDVEEAISFMKRHTSLGSLRKTVTSYGTSNTTISGVDVTCRCKIEITPKNLGYMDEIWRALYTYGLQPNFYVVWDMIPYSFIVDWLVPVGDIASVLDAEANYMNGQYDIKNVVFSMSYTRLCDDGYTYHCYHRWAQGPLPSLNELYWFDKPQSSNKVKTFRVLDTLSLVIK